MGPVRLVIMKVCILIFLLPVVLGTGTKPIGFNKGAPPLIRPLSGNKPYHHVVRDGNQIHQALNSKPSGKKVEDSPIVYKSGRPYEHSDAFMGNRRSYEVPDIPMGNRPYYGKEKKTVVAKKEVI